MTLQPLNAVDMRLLNRRFQELRRTEIITSKKISDLIDEWEAKVKPDGIDRAESFTLVYANGKSAGVAGPRWLFHMLGLRHRAAHIMLRTESGLILLQRRSHSRPDWPNCLDMTVAGHVPQNQQGNDLTYEQGAWKEIEEEIGLSERDAAKTLIEGKLTPIGEPYFSFDMDLQRNPPFYNAEARQIYVATLTGTGLSKLSFPDGEVTGLTLVTPETAWDLLAGQDIASGLRYSLPRYLDWLERQPPPQRETRRGL